jgi:hypothetical protein
MEEKRLEEIAYNLRSFSDVHGDDESLIIRTIVRLPVNVQEEVLEHVTFVTMPEGMYGYYYDGVFMPYQGEEIRDMPGKRHHFIVLNLCPIQDEEEKMYVIAHEIAHFISRHTGEGGIEVYNRQESDADRLVAKWGFTIPSRRNQNNLIG